MSDLSPDDVKEILRLVDESEFDEFELETPRFSVRFRRGDSSHPVSDTGQTSAREVSDTGQTPGHGSNGLVEVTSPMVGTFYRSPSPGAPPFVEVGSAVAADGQVCTIEVMKLMNSIVAGVAGTVEEICRADAAPVEYGDVLFRIRPA